MHGDYRLDNLLFGEDGTVTVLDWQTVSWGPPLVDASYFIGGCLPTPSAAATRSASCAATTSNSSIAACAA